MQVASASLAVGSLEFVSEELALYAALYFLLTIRYSIVMAEKSKYSENLITLRCSVCKRRNYYTRKNKRKVERKIELKKHCKWCRKHTLHKEDKK